MSNPQVELHITDYGVITLELDPAKAPKSVANFLSYVNSSRPAGTETLQVTPRLLVLLMK